MPNIPSSRVPIVQSDDTPSREWYRFFLSVVGFSTTVTLDFPNTAAGASSDLTVDVPGAAVGDAVTVGADAASVPVGGIFFGWVSAPDVVTIRYANNSLATAYNPGSGTFRVIVTRV